MIKTDYHIHSNFSHDGISTMEEHIKKAIELKLTEICFTEHYDIYDGLEKTTLHTIDVDNYVKNFLKFRNIYKGRINLKLGIEIGLQPDIQDIVRDMVGKYEFDFIIGSSHITCKKDISSDPSFFEGLTQKQAYIRYFEEVLKNVNLYDEFDVYGHIDYIIRYGGYENKTLIYSEYQEVLDEILKTLINKGKGIEVNTSGFKYGLETAHPNEEILKRYRSLGGKIITVGSDAHQTKELCSNFEKVYSLLKSLGYEYYTVFQNREPRFIKL